MKIAVIGQGYVGFSIAVVLARKFSVTVFDIDQKKIQSIDAKIAPINDPLLKDYFPCNNITASSNIELLGNHHDFYLICTPTNYDGSTGFFDTSSIITTLNSLSKIKPNKSLIIIKSTLPVGFCDEVLINYPELNIIYSPEFLREGSSIQDNLSPSRLVIGGPNISAEKFLDLMTQVTIKKFPVEIMGYKEAESVKLFANTYLAMRVAFFNELDTFCIRHSLSSKSVIKSICHDSRIGDYYNNPSFGYGGYCLPKDTKQLLSNFQSIPQKLFTAIVESNKIRKEFIAEFIKQNSSEKIGIYRLVMKSSSDNYRESAILDIIEMLKVSNKEVTIFEPLIEAQSYGGCKVINDIDTFGEINEMIIANRFDDGILPFSHKVFSRDIFNKD